MQKTPKVPTNFRLFNHNDYIAKGKVNEEQKKMFTVFIQSEINIDIA